MRKAITISALVLSISQAHAQSPFNTMDSIDINNINAAVLVHGDMWWNPVTQTGHCYYPKDTKKSISLAAALWMSGYDAAGQLHVSAQTYRQTGNDYWPGPLDSTGALSYTTSQDWAKIWKVKYSEIQSYLSYTDHTTSNTPVSILTWPGKGNTYATGNGGTPLTVTTDMAPFIDVNGDGIYEPLSGDYPAIKGEEALWWVFSDNGPARDSTTVTTAMKLQVRAMAYAYSRGTSIDNVIFYDYTVDNKSALAYFDFRVGLMADMNMGNYNDDFVGVDTARGTGIIYNGTPTDAVYGTSIPMAGVKLFALRTDSAVAGLGSFMYYNNDFGVAGNPTNDVQYNNYLRSIFRDGTHAANDFTVPGTATTGYGTGPNTNFVFSGDPAVNTQWSECSSGNTPGDRRFVIASGDVTLKSSKSAVFSIALVAVPPDTTNACGDSAMGFTNIHNVIDSATVVYDGGGLPPVTSAVHNVTAGSQLSIYPNPAHNELYIESSSNAAASIMIYNTLGQQVNVAISSSSNRSVADISQLPSGLYHVVYIQGSARKAATFIKE